MGSWPGYYLKDISLHFFDHCSPFGEQTLDLKSAKNRDPQKKVTIKNRARNSLGAFGPCVT